MGEITVRENRSDNLECTIQRLDSDNKAIRKTKGAGVKHNMYTSISILCVVDIEPLS
jgi:hypothetical protein